MPTFAFSGRTRGGETISGERIGDTEVAGGFKALFGQTDEVAAGAALRCTLDDDRLPAGVPHTQSGGHAGDAEADDEGAARLRGSGHGNAPVPFRCHKQSRTN